jgi:hypothetical protein
MIIGSFAKRYFMQNKKEQRAKKLEMIAQWQQSGLSQRAFCSTHNIAYHVFHYYYGVYRSSQTASNCFLPVKVDPVSHQQITLTGVSGIQVQVPFTDRSVHFIKQLLLS